MARESDHVKQNFVQMVTKYKNVILTLFQFYRAEYPLKSTPSILDIPSNVFKRENRDEYEDKLLQLEDVINKLEGNVSNVMVYKRINILKLVTAWP